MTPKIFVSALVAGAIAGLLAAALQFAFVIPLLLEGELYETGARVHFSETGAESISESPALGWDIQRHGLTVAFNLIAWIGFALIFVAAMVALSRRGWEINARTGAVWGLFAFLAVHLAPAVGLPPELPGTAAAEVGSRYLWWAGTIIATILAFGLMALRPAIGSVIAGAILLLAPHFYGAPHLENYFGVAPPELSALFATRTLAVAAATWVILGSVAGWMWDRD